MELNTVPSPVRPSVATQHPVVVYQSIAVLISIAAASFGIVLDPSVVVTAIAAVIAVAAPIFAAFKASKKVTPVADPYFDKP